jgi:hypothetical protein
VVSLTNDSGARGSPHDLPVDSRGVDPSGGCARTATLEMIASPWNSKFISIVSETDGVKHTCQTKEE